MATAPSKVLGVMGVSTDDLMVMPNVDIMKAVLFAVQRMSNTSKP